MDSTSVLNVKHRLVTFGIPVDAKHLSLGEDLVQSFLQTSPGGDLKTPIEVHARFIEHCAPRSPDIALAAFAAFNNSFCTRNNIHVVVQEHGLDANQAKAVLRGYFSAWNIASARGAVPSSAPALFPDPSVSMMAIFGGQGGMDNYLDEARDLVDIYGPLLADYPARISAFLQRESQDPRISTCYAKGLDVARWLASPESQPDPEYLLTVPVSIPAVGLIQLMQVMVAFKTLGLSPGELAKSFKVATGHSQGIAIATALSQVTDEQSFYAISEKVLGLLMLTGLIPQMEYPPAPLNPKAMESVSELDGQLYPMVSVQGVSRQVLESFITEFNSCQRDKDLHVFLSLVNTCNQFIISGGLESVVQFVKFVRSKSAPLDEDQSQIPFSQRKPKVRVNYTSITAPYHCRLLDGCIDRQCEYAVSRGWVLDAADMQIPVRAGNDGHDIRGEPDLTRYLFQSMCSLPVNWPVATDHAGTTHIVDFGPGGLSGFGSLTFRNVEGQGISVICAGAAVSRTGSLLGTKADLFKTQLSDVTSAPNWLARHGPRLVRTAHDDQIHIDSPMHHILGKPPVMVAGMTPTTANENFVAAINAAGYYAELAGGGTHKEADLNSKISSLTSQLEPGQTITLNCIYINPKQWQFQFPAILRMRREGVPITGLCIGGGVPSLENARDIVSSLQSAGFMHIAFKPANTSAIRVVLAIARENSTFPVLLQWTGGRAGGHHSLEDFHQPILETYGAIRSQPNVVLVAGSGFGDADGTLPYITGDWSKRFGRAPMPFDGILVGSRVLVAKEAATSLAVKELIAATPGLDDSEWERSYTGACGGVVTFVSEYGEKNHVLANRAALFARELQESVFSQPRDKQLPLLLARKAEIIEHLNRDHLRPWFGKKSDGRVVDIEEMTYTEVAHRLVETMYVRHQSRWIHSSYRNLVFDFLQRIEHRFSKDAALYFVHSCAQLDTAPFDFVSTVVSAYPASQTQLIGSEDVQFFINLCQRGGQKPIPFVPRIDASFYAWITEDAAWQSEDLDAVVDQDVQRIIVQHEPFAARYSTKVNEPVKDILDGIYHGQIAALLERYYGGDKSKVPAVEYLGAEPVVNTLPPSVIVADSSSERVYYLPTDESLLPDHSTWITTICGPRKSWLHALLTAPLIIQGSKMVNNYVRKIMQPRTDQIVTVYGDDSGMIQSLEITSSSRVKELDIAAGSNGVIVLTIYQPSKTANHALSFHFEHHPLQAASAIHEIMEGRDERIRRFYRVLWFTDDSKLTRIRASYKPADPIEVNNAVITREWVSEYCRITGNRSENYAPNSKKATLAPMDMLAIAAQDIISMSLDCDYVHTGSLAAIHLYNRIQYVDGARLLGIGDTVSCKSVITELSNTDIGKRIVVDGQIYREGTPIAVLQSSFLWRGVSIEDDVTYKSVSEPVSQVVLRSIEDVKALETREWFVYCEGSEGALQPGSVIEFHLKSDYRYSSKEIYSSIKTTGSVLLRSSTHRAAHIADVNLECGSSFGNPVTEYLARHGQPAESTAMFEGGGYEIVPKSSSDHTVAVVPDTNWPYSFVSTDYNPIHTNRYVADMAGLPGTITHGLWTSASTRCFIERHAASDQPERVRSYHVDYQGMVFPKDHLETKVFHVGMKDSRMLVKGQTFKAGGELVLDCTLEIEQETTAYVFTGQGSQETGMGMDLYESSSAARDVWNRAEQHMLKVYGVSLLRVVRTNPTQLTVFFGGKLGAQIRSNYMALSKHRDNKAARLFPGIADATGSFTFKSPGGLLNATQFTQPALVVLELAAVADLRSRSLVQKSAAFAGHSLGEYSALAAMGEVFSVEDAVDIAFYRGMVMQSAIDRDEQNRSQFGMVAVDPSRVGSGFDENALALVVETIRTQAQGLLEIVNYNIKGSQYVVAGSLALLAAMGSVIDRVAEQGVDVTGEVGRAAIGDVAAEALASTGGAPLKRGRATVPLAGIDVPFHSTQLAPGVEPFREYLLSMIDSSSVDYSTLHNRYIPNLTGLPFEVSRDYFRLVHDLTKSPVIGNHLQRWDDSLLDSPVEAAKLGHVLLVELLAYQFASPVRWIETQSHLFNEMKTERLIEVGPSATLCGMAEKTRRLLESPTTHAASILHVVRDRADVYYEYESTPSSDAEPEQEPEPAGGSQPAPALPAPQQSSLPPPSAGVPSNSPGAAIADTPLEAVDVIQTIVAHKLKRALDVVPVDRSIKELTGGKSTLQNEILGDLQKEISGTMPDKPEELPLRELATAVGSFVGTLGKHTSSHIARLFSAKMPGGFTQSAARTLLQTAYGLGPQRQDALLLVALTMEPASRLPSEAEAKAWLDSVAQAYAKSSGIAYTAANASGGGGSVGGAVINSAEFDKAQREQREHVLQQMQVLARYAGVDLREGARSSESTSAEKQILQSKLDRIEAEFGADLVEGTETLFDTRKARRYNSSWNWARQEAVEWVYSVLAGREQPLHDQANDSARLHALANRSTPALLSLVAATISAMGKSSDELSQQAVAVAKRIYAVCKEALDSAPIYKEFSSPMRPVTRISFRGVVEYSETPRENEPSFVEYVQHMQSEAGAGDPPLLHLKEKAKRGGTWTYSAELSRVYFGALEQMSTTGLSFAGKTALITGCGRGSIGADILRGLLAGGARVVATTSSYSRKTTLFYEEMYREHGARGSELVVVPFNQGSTADTTALVEYIYSDASGSKGLGWDLDFLIPFAAISEVGSDITGLNSRSELAHRVMLTNVLRLLGMIKDTKERLSYRTRPTLVVLPLSPNHGDFGGDGLYGESKIGLETVFNRWRSEAWEEYMSIAGAVIGWTRGTGLMGGNNAIAHEMEKLGARTFSTSDMAFNILGLLHPTIGGLAVAEPVWADLNGGLQCISQLDEAAADARSSLLTSSSIKKAVFIESANDYDVVTRGGAMHIYLDNAHGHLPNHRHPFPVIKSYEQLEHLRHLQGMVNLDKVVVVTGYGEVGPFGNAEHRWEMEAFGEFSLEGCIELAWIMGLIKHHNGPLQKTGTTYTGWVDAKSGEPVRDRHIKARYEKHILEHTGVRLIEPELVNGYDPSKKLFMRELQIEHDMEPFEATADEAAAFKHQNGDKVDVWENKDGSWSVRFLKGAVILVSKALRFDRLVAAQIPTGWDPAHYGIPEDTIKQVDLVTCYALVAAVEALVRSGITDPYELYRYFHVSEIGNSMGSGIGGANKLHQAFVKRFLDGELQSDVLQETFINTIAAWINMLLLSSSGPIKATVGACATSVLSVDIAVETIQSGKARMMLAGGVEGFIEEASYEFAQMGATSNSLEEFASGRTPKEMCRPCTSTRNGFMEGEGAGVVTLMSASAAIEFGAPIYGIVAMSGTATDKQGSSVPAPGQGVLTSARETAAGVSPRLLDINYRRRQLDRQLVAINEWVSDELEELNSEADLGAKEAITTEAERQRSVARDAWGNDFWRGNPRISPLRGSLAVWGLTVDDIGVASFHGTSTVANDKNESEVLNRQMEHLGRTPGLAVPAVCQKWLTGHSKGAAAAFMLNGVLQSLRSGIVPGNRNADNIAAELEKFEYIVYPSRSIQTPGIKAGLLKSFGFGQVGGEILVVHPDYLLAALTCEQLDEYNEKLQEREAKSYRYWQDTLVGNHPFIQVKEAPPYTLKQEQQVYLDPLARAKYDSATKQCNF